LSEEMKHLIRHAHIGAAVCAAVYAVGLFLFHSDETVIHVVAGAGPAAGFGVYMALTARYYRACDKESRGSR
jgi:hypothetical protein